MSGGDFAPEGIRRERARQELAARLRFLLDRRGLTPGILAAEEDLPYPPETIYRYFSGDELPPLSLVALVANRCGGDLAALESTYAEAAGDTVAGGAVTGDAAGGDAVTAAAAAAKAPRRGPRHRRPPDPAVRGRRRTMAAVTAGLLGGAAVVTVLTLTGGARSGAPAPPAAADAVPTDLGTPTPTPSPVGPPEPKGPAGSATPTPSPTPSPRPSAVELLANGTFSRGIAPWTDDDVNVFADDGLLIVEVNGDDGVVDSEDVRLRKGRTYVLTFQAAASEPIEIEAQVREHVGERFLDRTIDLGEGVRTFSFTFRPDENTSDAFVRFDFDIDDNYEVAIDNVSLKEQRG